MISAITYGYAVLWACAVPCVFAVVSDRAGMNRHNRLAVLRALWAVPALIACAALACGVLVILTATP